MATALFERTVTSAATVTVSTATRVLPSYVFGVSSARNPDRVGINIAAEDAPWDAANARHASAVDSLIASLDAQIDRGEARPFRRRNG